ncbi:MAG: hypothetical protein IKD27_03025 [Oscillospiraceae bacterium]|nr:hypothetical protein [Oscillospiraceae bacterium]
MRKLVCLLVLMTTLSGCVNMTEPVFETIADEIEKPVAAEPKPIAVWLPDDAAAQTVADGDTGKCYTWGECELRLQTLSSGDIRTTLQKLSGLSPDKLTVMEYRRDGLQIYQTVWSATGEEGITLGRCMVADDGDYHYCISLLSPEDADVAEDFAQICASLDLSGETSEK